jgi:hypothetical protein
LTRPPAHNPCCVLDGTAKTLVENERIYSHEKM